MNTCKSPTHKKYTEAAEDLDITAGLVIRRLTEARSVGKPDSSERLVAVTAALSDATARIDWATKRFDKATMAVDAHIDSRCRLVR